MSVNQEVALSKLIVLRNQLSVVAHNMANPNTAGFQRLSVPQLPNTHRAGPMDSIYYVQDQATYRDTSQGTMIETHNQLHCYLRGTGYFAVQTPRGIRFTRSGAFTLDNQSRLTTSEGYLVLDQGQAPILIPEGATNLNIGQDGVISQNGDIISTLGIFRFDNLQDMRNEEGTLLETAQVPIPALDVRVTQYAHEGSNVQTIKEVTHLVELMRQYQEVEKIEEEFNKLASETITSLGKSLQI